MDDEMKKQQRKLKRMVKRIIKENAGELAKDMEAAAKKLEAEQSADAKA